MDTLLDSTLVKHKKNKWNNMLYKHYAYVCATKNLHNIYSSGINNKINDLKLFSIHAEMDAINKFKRLRHLHTNKIDIISLRVNNLNEFQNSKPCIYCLNALKTNKYRINFIIYYEDNKLIKEKFNNLLHQIMYVPRSYIK
jgi:tRNA(Arg) A34 adenosine deaminase TadA